MVRARPNDIAIHVKLVVHLAAHQVGRLKPDADLDALDGADPHERAGKVRVQLREHGRADARRNAHCDGLYMPPTLSPLRCAMRIASSIAPAAFRSAHLTGFL